MSDLSPLFSVRDWVFNMPANTQWWAVVIGVSLFVTCVISTSMTYRRLAAVESTRRWVVPLINVLSFLLITMLIMDIRKTELSEAKLNVLTRGYDTAQPLSEWDDNNTVTVAIANQFDEEGMSLLPHNSLVIPSATDLLPFLTSYPNITVWGDGLSRQQWQDLTYLNDSDVSVLRRANQPLQGVVDLTWSKSSFVGENNTFSARLQINNSDDTLYEVRLIEPSGAALDKTVVGTGERFSLNFRPKIAGRWLYSLETRLLSSKAVISTEQISVDVKKARQLNVLVKQSAPSFDTKQLQNWLVGYGNAITVLTKISRDKHLVQRVNTDERGLDSVSLNQGQFSEDILSAMDFVVLDGRAFSGLTDNQQDLLARAAKRGLGILILADKSLFDYLGQQDQPQSTLLSGFSLTPHNDDTDEVAQETPVLVRWSNHQSQLPIKISPYLLSAVHAETLAYDEDGHSIVASKNVGRGRVALSLINQSYQWQTSGERDSYSRYWQNILLRVARDNQNIGWLPQRNSHVATVNQRHRVCAALTDEMAPKINAEVVVPSGDATPIVLTQVELNETLYCTVIWPQDEGWHRLTLNHENSQLLAEQQVYVFGKSHWQAEIQRHSHAATRDFSEQYDAIVTVRSAKLLEKWPLVLLLLCCLTYLWFERKFLH